MKNLSRNYIPALPIACLLSATCPSVRAQQLPNVQTVGVLAPSQVKTDGKATEWAGKFEAYNKATSLYYIMANDNKSLYLTIKATDTLTIERIIKNGIALTIKSMDKDNQLMPFTIIYPISLHSNSIKVTGTKQLPDSLISTVNKLGIETAAATDQQKNYIYELAISLKYLVPLITDMGAFNYTIILNNSKTSAPLSFSGKYTLVID